MATLGREQESSSSIAIEEKKKTIKGSVVLMKKKVLDCNDSCAAFLDRLDELFGRRVSLQLISSTHADPENDSRGKLGKPAYLEKWFTTIAPVGTGEIELSVTFEWNQSMGRPGAFLIRNHHHSELYLKTLTLNFKEAPGHDLIHFVCNSWVYPVRRYKHNRVFFANKAYLTCATPEPLRKYREEELSYLRGDGTGMLMEWDRVYDYEFYNDLGSPDKGPKYARPVLGGSDEYPYPRRGRTGRPRTKIDPAIETRLPLLSLNMYVPRDERFSHVKLSDFLGYAIKSIIQLVVPEFKSICDRTFNEFDTIQDVLNLYEGSIKIPPVPKLRDCIPWELLKELLRSDGEQLLKFPVPAVIKADPYAWRTDEEFAREMLAGTNPVVIRLLEKFPPASKLNPKEYGDHRSKIAAWQIENIMEGLTVDQAMEGNRLFILDYHDKLIPYLSMINSTSSKIYASRTLLFLKDDGTLKPLAIELSLPNSQGIEHGSVSRVFTPPQKGNGDSIWQLAKAYVAVNDSGYHQLVSHWLLTHASMEPFVIASNRQLSVLHPIYKLLYPHFRDNMYINALARQILISAGGVLENTVFPAKFSMQMSSMFYKTWNFTEQALPADLLKRGIAVPDENCPHGLRLLIEDYPYAVDGLQLWSAIQAWVTDYCSFYYTEKESVISDSELQSWWWEIRNVGHGDKRDEIWWPKMNTPSDLIQICTIIIWIASAFHAAINFGQYPYAGYLPNRPTLSRRFMPEMGTEEYKEAELNPEAAFLKTITSQFQTLLGISLIEILSRHSSEEIYLGQRESPYWTCEEDVLEAFERFRAKLVEIEDSIMEMNKDARLKNRTGPVKVPYTLLYPSTSESPMPIGLTGRGIPNSITI